MPRRAPIPKCSEQDKKMLQQLAGSRTEEARLVERAKIILNCLQGERVHKIARDLQVRPNTVIEWRRRFEKEGAEGLKDQPRSGKPARYGAVFRGEVLNALELPPPAGQARWDGPAVAKHLDTSVHAVWGLLRKEGICLSRQRSWCVSTDPEFISKAADIVGLYLYPPENALVISVVRKAQHPGIGACHGLRGNGQWENCPWLQEHIQTPRDSESLCSPGDCHRGHPHPNHAAEAPHRVPDFYGSGGNRSPRRQGDSCHPRQLLYPQEERRMVGGPSERSFSFHANIRQLAESSGDMVWYLLPQSAQRCQLQKH